MQTEEVDSYQEMTAKVAHYAQAEEFGRPNDNIVVAAGLPFHTTGDTNNIRVLQIRLKL